MSIYLLDYENIKDFSGIERLKDEDQLIIFYSENSKNISLVDIDKMIKRKIQLELKSVGSGAKNALDFQLSSYLGYIIEGAKGKSQDIYIVSKDKGYETLVDFWKREKGVDVKIVVNFRGETTANKNNDLKKVLAGLDIGLSQDDIQKCIEIINTYKTMMAINNNINKYLKSSDKVGKVMKAIKNHIKDKN